MAELLSLKVYLVISLKTVDSVLKYIHDKIHFPFFYFSKKKKKKTIQIL